MSIVCNNNLTMTLFSVYTSYTLETKCGVCLCVPSFHQRCDSIALETQSRSRFLLLPNHRITVSLPSLPNCKLHIAHGRHTARINRDNSDTCAQKTFGKPSSVSCTPAQMFARNSFVGKQSTSRNQEASGAAAALPR